MRKTFLISLLIAGISLSFKISILSGQTESGQESLSISSRTSKLVTAIEVKGNKSISSNTVLSKMKTRIGAPSQDNIISDDLKRLYLLGFFSDIRIDTEDYKDGIKVIVNVVERPIIEKITFSGIRRMGTSEEKLKQELKSKEAQYLDYPSVTEDEH
jgi:outer membrane protein insertion porin family